MSQNYNITITASTPNTVDPNDSSLTLDDNGQTTCDPGDTITWKIGQGSGVGRICSISKDTGSSDLFGPPESNEPAPQGNSGNWRGTINADASPNAEEDYTICWYTDADPEVGPYCYDPQIKINP